MKQTFIFVYAKELEIKVLDIEETKKLHLTLLNEGWVHTNTLDACLYIQHLHNECKNVDLIKEIRSLTKLTSLS